MWTRIRHKALFHLSCAVRCCRLPTCSSAEYIGGNNPEDWNQKPRNGSGKARKCSLTGSHERQDFPSSMQALKHHVSEWCAVCGSFLCSCPQAGVGKEGRSSRSVEEWPSFQLGYSWWKPSSSPHRCPGVTAQQTCTISHPGAPTPSEDSLSMPLFPFWQGPPELHYDSCEGKDLL